MMLNRRKESQRASRPLGWWICTHAKPDSLFSQNFTVGEYYECSERGGCARIWPHHGGSWAPYWQEHSQKFCYSQSEISFEYVGLKKPKITPEVEQAISVRRQIEFHLDAIRSLMNAEALDRHHHKGSKSPPETST